MTHVQRAPLGLAHYVQRGILSSHEAAALSSAIDGGESVLIAGRTNTGKTTFARALLRELPTSHARTVIVQHTAELKCASHNQISLPVAPPHYTARDAVRDALRLRPDRIVLDDTLEFAAAELFRDATTSDRPPSLLATIHADSIAGSLQRLCQLIDERGGGAARASVARTFRLCAYLARDRTGSSVRVERLTETAHGGGWCLSPLLCA